MLPILDQAYIPKQLQRKEFRFIKLGRRGTELGKRPLEKKWSSINNYEWDNFDIRVHSIRYNIGIVTGYGNLLVLDFDNEDYQNYLISELPETFTVKSGGKGLYHLYYFIDENFNKFPIKKKILSVDGLSDEKTMVDVLSKGAYVVVPYSQHSSGRFYTVEKDLPISHITQAKLKEVFGNDFKPKESKGLPPSPVAGNILTNGKIEFLKNNVKISTILNYFGIETRTNRTSCPAHPVSPGNHHNFEYDDNKNIWYCFDKQEGGKNIDLIMHITGCSVAEAITALESLYHDKNGSRP